MLIGVIDCLNFSACIIWMFLFYFCRIIFCWLFLLRRCYIYIFGCFFDSVSSYFSRVKRLCFPLNFESSFGIAGKCTLTIKSLTHQWLYVKAQLIHFALGLFWVCLCSRFIPFSCWTASFANCRKLKHKKLCFSFDVPWFILQESPGQCFTCFLVPTNYIYCVSNYCKFVRWLRLPVCLKSYPCIFEYILIWVWKCETCNR